MRTNLKTPDNNNPTMLIVSKAKFKDALEKRISLGQELFDRDIYFTSCFDLLKEDYYDWSDYNSEYLKQAFNKENNEYRKDHTDIDYMEEFAENGEITISFDQKLQGLKEEIHFKIKNLKQLRAKTDLLKPDSIDNPAEKATPTELNKSQVFIVHGHDEEAKAKAARFVEKLGYEAIILHEQASSSKTIIEKVEEYSNVGFGIILYTPCDVGAKQDASQDLKPRARQNVVFEHGYLIGKIQRSNVCALVKGDVETPNDISGVVYISMNDDDAWMYEVGKEMKKSGYDVDMNKI